MTRGIAAIGGDPGGPAAAMPRSATGAAIMMLARHGRGGVDIGDGLDFSKNLHLAAPNDVLSLRNFTALAQHAGKRSRDWPGLYLAGRAAPAGRFMRTELMSGWITADWLDAGTDAVAAASA